MKFYRWLQRHSIFQIRVVGLTFFLMLLLLGGIVLAPTAVQNTLNGLKQGVFDYFSWFYVLAFSIFLLFLIYLACSRFGNIKLGGQEEKPEFSLMSWLAMLFAAGMGVGLMFFGVAEPLTHYYSLQPQQPDAGEALLYTVFHWGFHAWAVYGVMALALAYFAFRYQLPLSLRSCFYPLLKDKINGGFGDAIDTLALVATLFGLITTLGFGAAQMGAGLVQLNWLGENHLTAQIILIVLVMALAVFSASSGVGRGVKILSEWNLKMALILLLFVLLSGPTLHILAAFSQNLGLYLSHWLELSFKTYVHQPEKSAWFSGWTVLYWAWWCSWSPFVGLFIARISRGRSVREFVLGVLFIPSLFCLLWFTVFGNGAIWLAEQGGADFKALLGQSETLLFAFLNHLPLPQISSLLALAIIALFFITSADSGIYVLNSMASRDKSLTAPRWQAVFWGLMMGSVAIALLANGGLGQLQTMTLIAALPFALLLLLMCFSLWKGMQADREYYGAKITPSSVFWTGERWQQRLNQMLNQSQAADAQQFLRETALPAFQELQQELRQRHGLRTELNARLEEALPELELRIQKDSLRDFVYGIRVEKKSTAAELIAEKHLPHIRHQEYYELLSYFFDGRAGYDVQYMTRKELIADVLKHYERYLQQLQHLGRELLSHEPTELAE